MIKTNFYDLTRVPSIGPATASTLSKHGIQIIPQLAKLNSNHPLAKILIGCLIVFDSLTERIYLKEIDFKNPTNINIYY